MRPSPPRSVGRSVVATLLLLAALASAAPPTTHADDGHSDAPATVEVHRAGVGITSLWTWAVVAWNALTGVSDICDDCNYPVDDGCKCVCYSGGYDPDDPACQF